MIFLYVKINILPLNALPLFLPLWVHLEEKAGTRIKSTVKQRKVPHDEESQENDP